MASSQLVTTISSPDGQQFRLNYDQLRDEHSQTFPHLFHISNSALQNLMRSRGAATFVSAAGCEQGMGGGEERGEEEEATLVAAAGRSEEEKVLGPCRVCGDNASGKYFGALVCVPCKTFFLRYAGDSFQFICKRGKSCEINVATRIQCKYCRYKKCIEAGMHRKVRPTHIELKEGRQLCVVCSDLGNGVHFGAITCEGCKKFFRRALNEHRTYLCKQDQKCGINPQTRNSCRYCRYIKCCQSGMSRKAIQMGRPSKINQIPLQNSQKSDSQPTSQTKENRVSTQRCKATPTDTTSATPQEETAPVRNPTRIIYAQPDSTTVACVKQEDLPLLRNTSPDPPFFFLPRTMFSEHALRLRADPSKTFCGDVICSSPSITSSDEVGRMAADPTVVAMEAESEMNCNQENEIEVTMKQSLNTSVRYWSASLPDENLLFSDHRHWEFINSIFPNYDRFVQTSDKINACLRQEFEIWRLEKEKNGVMSLDKRSDWIKIKVIPAYTVVSVAYCKKIPGFSSFNQSDQIKMIRLGQSPSRILAATLHWFDDESRDFKYFLYWREKDRFKDSIISLAEKIRALQLDPIEAALLNALLIVATDYPDLVDGQTIENQRHQIISTFRAYTTAKYGTPNDRMEMLFKRMPDVRKLGLLHHEMTSIKNMRAEELGEKTLSQLNI